MWYRDTGYGIWTGGGYWVLSTLPLPGYSPLSLPTALAPALALALALALAVGDSRLDSGDILVGFRAETGLYTGCTRYVRHPAMYTVLIR